MVMPNFYLKGKVVLLTGARRGIGRTFAIAFAEAGADISVIDYLDDGGELDEVKNSIEAIGRKAITSKANVTIKADVEQMVRSTVEAFGTIDILINNAGIGCPEKAQDISEENWDKVIDTNVKGCLLCSQAVSKIMIPRKTGNIINMASIAGFTANNPSGFSYDVAKAGMIMLTRALSRELAPYKIRVNAICPYVIETDMTQHFNLMSNMVENEHGIHKHK